MSLSNAQLTERIQRLEQVLRELLTATNNIPTKKDVNAWQLINQNQINTLQSQIDNIESGSGDIGINAHNLSSSAHTVLNDRYFQKTEFINTSAGAADASKPVKLNSSGLIDATMIALTAEDHGSLSGLSDDDHTQYHTDARALTWLGTRSTNDLPENTNLYYTEARVSANTDVAANTAARHTRAHDVDSSSDHNTSSVGNRGKFVKANSTTGAIEFASIADSDVPDTITLSNITQITSRSHSDLSNLTANDHTQYYSSVASPIVASGQQLTFNANYSNDFYLAGNNQLRIQGSGITHSGLSGLSADDHTQYHTDARGDARYYLQTQVDTKFTSSGVTNGNSHDHSGGDGAQIDHGGLAGLSDDDHTQYHNDIRGDVRYYTQTQLDTKFTASGVTNGNTHDHSGGDGAQVDHGGLNGLGDDDHSQYLLANGTRALAGSWDLQANALTQVGNVTFYGTGLLLLDLQGNDIANVDDLTFLNSSSTIDMQGGDIVTVDDIIFQGTNSLLDLQGGRITSGTGALRLGTDATTDHGLTTDDVLVGGKLEVNNNAFIDGTLTISGQAYSIIQATLTPTGTTQTVNWNTGNSQILTLASATGTVTLTFSNPLPGATYVLKIIQHASSAKDITWPATVKWPDGIIPVITTTASAVDIASFFYDGTNYYGNIGQAYA